MKNANFCQILTFIYSYFCTLRMFLTFTYLFSCRCRSDDVYVDFSLDLVCSRRYGTVCDFRECFEKSLYGRNPLLTIQNLSLLPWDIRFSTNEGYFYGLVTANVQKVLEVRVRSIACLNASSSVLMYEFFFCYFS